jgi:hypothetical protein
MKRFKNSLMGLVYLREFFLNKDLKAMFRNKCLLILKY